MLPECNHDAEPHDAFRFCEAEPPGGPTPTEGRPWNSDCTRDRALRFANRLDGVLESADGHAGVYDTIEV